MRHPIRFLAAVASVLMTLTLVLATVVYCIVGTSAGRFLLRKTSNEIAASLLGPGFTAQLGEQTVDLLEDGSLAIKWSDVSMTRKGAASPVAKLRTVKAGIRLLPLLEGRFHVDTLEVAGAEIDVTGDRWRDEARIQTADADPVDDSSAASPDDRQTPFLPTLSDNVLKGAEKQIRMLLRLGLDDVSLSDVTVVAPFGKGGGPFVARLDRADLDLSDPAALTLSAVVGVDRLALPLDAVMRYDGQASRLASMTLNAGPFPLGRLVPPGSPADRLDSRPFATDAAASATLDLASRPDDGRRTVHLALDLGAGSLQAGRGHTRVEAARLGFSYLEGEDAVALDPSRLAFDAFSMTLSGRASPLYDRSGSRSFDGFGFAVDADRMRSTIGSASGDPVTATLRLEGRTSSSAKEIALSRFTLRTDRGQMGGVASLRFGTPDSKTFLNFTSENLTAGDVKAFWPFNLASNTRRWVLDHVGDRGIVRNGTIALDLSRERLAKVFRPENHPDPREVDLEFQLEDVALKTFGELPGLMGVSGSVHTTGGDTLVSLTSGRAEGMESVEMTPSTVRFVRAPPTRPHELDGSLTFGFTGEMRDLLTIAGRKPVGGLQAIEVDPADVTGRAAVTADLAFVLGDDIPKERQFGPWALALDLDRAGLKTPVEGRVISDVIGPVKIVPGTASGEVAASIDGFPARISFVQPFGPQPLGEEHLEIDASLSGEAAAARAPSLSDVVDGPLAVRVVRDDGGDFRASVDLSAASLKLSALGWRKGKGIPATITFDIAGGAGETSLKNLSVKGDGFAARGTVVADRKGLRSADLADVMLNPDDDVDVSVQRVDNGFSIRISGERFDARPFLGDLKANLGAKARNRKAPGKPQLDIGVAIKRLTGFGDSEMRDFSLDFAGSGGEIAALSLSGRSGKNDAFTVDVSPRGTERSIRVRAPDAGMLAEFTGLYGRMKKGAIALDLIGSSEDGYRGGITAENFTLVDEPRLSRLVRSSPSPSGRPVKAVDAALKTERAFFDHASAGIVYGKNGLQVSDGIIRGPDFGSSFSGVVYDTQNRIDIVGSFMPAYGLNRIFGAIPLVGPILGNGREGGLIGITFRLNGGFASPTLTVNPISAIAPGIFRNIFAYQ